MEATETLADSHLHAALHQSKARVVWGLAWPAVALNSLQVINTLLDRGFIGRLPSDALTAQGASISVMFMMMSLAMTLGTAATALVSRSFGAREIAEYRMASKQCLSLTLLLFAGFGALTVSTSGICARFLLPADAHGAAKLMTGYLLIYGLGLPAIAVIQTLAGSLRAVGDTKSPMMISGLQIFMHMTLNILLIFPTRHVMGISIPGANMGLLGAATALGASSWVSAIIYISYSAKTPLGNQWAMMLPTVAWTTRILRITIPAALMAVLRVASFATFSLILAGTPDGARALAAMSAGLGVEQIMFMPAFGLSAASSALVGQSLGMKRPDRAEQLAWTAGHHGALVTICLSSAIFLAAPTIMRVMIPNDPAIAASATVLIRALSATEFLFSYAMVMIGALQGAGDTVAPMWLSIISMWGLRVPMVLVSALPPGFKLFAGLAMPFGLGFGSAGAWYVMSITQGVNGLLAIAVFKRGKWKLKQV